jgi:hypothetical protein
MQPYNQITFEQEKNYLEVNIQNKKSNMRSSRKYEH